MTQCYRDPLMIDPEQNSYFLSGHIIQKLNLSLLQLLAHSDYSVHNTKQCFMWPHIASNIYHASLCCKASTYKYNTNQIYNACKVTPKCESEARIVSHQMKIN